MPRSLVYDSSVLLSLTEAISIAINTKVLYKKSFDSKHSVSSSKDILVGSFESNKAILLRSHTLVVINVKTTFSFDPIDLDVKDCTNDDVLDNPTSAQKQTYAW